MARTACIVCLFGTVVSRSQKKKKNCLEGVVLVAGTQQNLSNLHSLDIYELCHYSVNTKRGSITVPLTSCLTGLELAV
jgi:hypothetical protein